MLGSGPSLDRHRRGPWRDRGRDGKHCVGYECGDGVHLKNMRNAPIRRAQRTCTMVISVVRAPRILAGRTNRSNRVMHHVEREHPAASVQRPLDLTQYRCPCAAPQSNKWDLGDCARASTTGHFEAHDDGWACARPVQPKTALHVVDGTHGISKGTYTTIMQTNPVSCTGFIISN